MNYIELYPESAMFYVSVILLGTLLSHIASKRNSRAAMIGVIVLYVSVAGFRSSSVGIDTSGYLMQYNETLTYGPSAVSGWHDHELTYVMYLVSFFGSYSDYTFLVSIPAYALTIHRFWELRKSASFAVSIAAFSCLYFPLSLNISRQFLAAAIVFWGSRYFFNKGFIKYVVFVLAATLIHRSSLIGLALFALLPLYREDYKGGARTLLTLSEVLLPVALLTIFFIIMDRYSSTYLSNASISIGFTGILKFSCAILFLLLIKGDSAKNPLSRESKLIVTIALMGLVVSLGGYAFKYLDRIVLIFLLFEPVLYGLIAKAASPKTKKLFGLYLFFLLSFSLFSVLAGNGQGIMPYSLAFS